MIRDAAVAAQKHAALGSTFHLSRYALVQHFEQYLFQDLRYGIRSLRKDLGFTVTAVVTLALGLGINAATFAVSYGILWRPLPYEDPARLVRVLVEGPDGDDWGIERTEVNRWLSSFRATVPMAGYYSRALTLRGPLEARTVTVAFVTADFFDVLGTPAAAGQTSRFSQAPDLVVMSHRLAAQLSGGSVGEMLGTV